MNMQDPLIDDGAREVVDVRPLRAKPVVASLSEVLATPIGGRMAKMRAAGDRARREFLHMRTPAGAVKMALVHVPVARALVRAYNVKRARCEEDFGCTIAEIAAAGGLDEAKVRNVLPSLVKNQAVRSKVSHVGWQGVRGRYYPTDLGYELIAMAERWGEGVMVQLGAPANAWRSPSLTEPSDIFQNIDLIKNNLA